MSAWRLLEPLAGRACGDPMRDDDGRRLRREASSWWGPDSIHHSVSRNDRAPLAQNRGERGSVISWSCGDPLLATPGWRLRRGGASRRRGPLDSLARFTHEKCPYQPKNRVGRGISHVWSCGESNPGPTALSQGFSGCSLSSRFSRPWRSNRRVANRPSHS